MNFSDYFINTIENQAPSNESLELLAKFMNDDPLEYASNLLSIAINGDFEDKIKINAIKALPAPIRLINSKNLPLNTEFNIYEQIYITLEPHLHRND
ncbi:hypothetical protein TVAG_066200 [Trichomonas vaginalis G3]|uniref:Uncharacterized protein n=1 Tax=Trichomonas vaginalis (strain ATCC PRA-98 / G3) TaxID=412133 RepID=A2FV50_TRIV3|nr:hypothetical protein TVAGG3_0879950 [Trichomonas vaginalis G3]EAX91215.1 hypothetical protein TVAG_066200 [Trichomonas vaginalis G3]KAI5501976.1 hypothetical protein TVAGG3_0879950 [Trichomonas vaginalis G3]|eukprot:XP_001304145.1 hypothetical protein [Trichomonas vaginalis G3]